MKKQLFFILMSLFSLQPCLALAEGSYSLGAKNTYSLALDYGVSNYDYYQPNSSTASTDTNPNLYRIAIDYNYQRYLAFEVYYANLGKLKIHGNSGDSYTVNGVSTTFSANSSIRTDKLQSLGGNAVLMANFEGFALYAKLGAFRWKDDYQTTAPGVVTTSGGNSGVGFLAGFGYAYALIIPNTSVRVEYDQIHFDSTKATLISAGLTVHF